MPTIVVDGYDQHLTLAYAHFIPGHPKCGRLHGHSGAVSVEIEGETRGEFGFVMDFGIVKPAVRRILENMDHRTLLPVRLSRTFDPAHNAYVIEKTMTNGRHARYMIPQEDTFLVDREQTTAEALAEYVRDELNLNPVPRSTHFRHRVAWHEGKGSDAWTDWQ